MSTPFWAQLSDESRRLADSGSPLSRRPPEDFRIFEAYLNEYGAPMLGKYLRMAASNYVTADPESLDEAAEETLLDWVETVEPQDSACRELVDQYGFARHEHAFGDLFGDALFAPESRVPSAVQRLVEVCLEAGRKHGDCCFAVEHEFDSPDDYREWVESEATEYLDGWRHNLLDRYAPQLFRRMVCKYCDPDGDECDRAAYRGGK